MRNLKRALSLALASVMLLGMMVVGTGASYADVDSADNVEAIEVMQAVGVMVGDTNGNFNPDQKVTRGEMAVVMANLLNLNVKDFIGAKTPFTDVPEWAVPYVAACYADGITAGISATQYGFNYEVTTAQAALMMMKALGYFQFAPDFGQDWQVATVKQGSTINIFDGIKAGASTALTRNEVAQMALNALKADMVTYTGSQGTNITMPDGSSIVTGYTIQYVARTDINSRDYSVGTEGDATLQLVENLYGNDLKMKSTDNDDMGRPAVSWTYPNAATEIGVYAKTPDYVVVADEDNGADRTVDGVIDTISKNLDTTTALTGNIYVNGNNSGKTVNTTVKAGSAVEVYLNNAGNVNYVAITEYDVATISAAVAKKTTDGVDYISVPGVTAGYVKAKEVKGDLNLVKDDVVLYYKDSNNVYYIEKATSVEGVVSGLHSTKGVLVGGTYYDISSSMTGASCAWSNDYTNTWTFYLNKAGAVVKAVQKTNEIAGNYVVVADVAWVQGSGVEGSNYVEAKIVKTDGSTEIVKIASVDGVKAVAVGSTLAASSSNHLYYFDSSVQDATSNVAAKAKTYYYTNPSSTNVEAKYYGVSVTGDLTAATGLNVMTNTTTGNATGTNAYITEGRFYAFELDNDGNYKLSTTAIGDDTFANISDSIKDTGDTANIGAPTNNNTVFIYAVTNADGDVTYTVYNGYDKAPKATSIAQTAHNEIVVNKAGFATLVYVAVSDGNVAGSYDKDLIYITDASYTTMKEGNKTYYVQDAVVNGVKGTVKLTTNYGVGMYTVSAASSEGYLTLTGTLTGVATSETGVKLVGSGTFTTSTTTWTYTSSTVAYYIDADGNSTQVSVDALSQDATDSVYVVENSNTTKQADKIYVVEKDAEPTAVTLAAGTAAPSVDQGNLLTGAGAVSGWVTSTNDQVKITVTPVANTTATITINGASYTSASDYTIAATGTYTVLVTVTDSFSNVQNVYTYTFSVTA